MYEPIQKFYSSYIWAVLWLNSWFQPAIESYSWWHLLNLHIFNMAAINREKSNLYRTFSPTYLSCPMPKLIISSSCSKFQLVAFYQFTYLTERGNLNICFLLSELIQNFSFNIFELYYAAYIQPTVPQNNVLCFVLVYDFTNRTNGLANFLNNIKQYMT